MEGSQLARSHCRGAIAARDNSVTIDLRPGRDLMFPKTLSWSAATLAERIARLASRRGDQLPARREDSGRLEAALVPWADACARGNVAALHRRLSWDAIDPDVARAALTADGQGEGADGRVCGVDDCLCRDRRRGRAVCAGLRNAGLAERSPGGRGHPAIRGRVVAGDTGRTPDAGRIGSDVAHTAVDRRHCRPRALPVEGDRADGRARALRRFPCARCILRRRLDLLGGIRVVDAAAARVRARADRQRVSGTGAARRTARRAVGAPGEPARRARRRRSASARVRVRGLRRHDRTCQPRIVGSARRGLQGRGRGVRVGPAAGVQASRREAREDVQRVPGLASALGARRGAPCASCRGQRNAWLDRVGRAGRPAVAR